MDARSRLVPLDDLTVSVWLHTAKDPPHEEWVEACSILAEWVRTHSENLASLRVLVVTDGGMPNASQRKELYQNVLQGHPVPTAVLMTILATNPIKRGVATTLNLLTPTFHAFEPQEVHAGLQHIGVPQTRFAPIWSVLQFLQSGMPPIEGLRLVANTMGLSFEQGRYLSVRSRPPPR